MTSIGSFKKPQINFITRKNPKKSAKSNFDDKLKLHDDENQKIIRKNYEEHHGQYVRNLI